MSSPDTSAQDAPVASQEAEARYVVRYRDDDPWPCYELVDTVTGSVLVDDGGAPEDRNLYRDFAPLVAELNRVARLLASERERYAALAEAARAYYKAHIAAIGLTAPPWTTEEERDASIAKWRSDMAPLVKEEAKRLNELHDAIRALAALEEAGSA